MSPGLREAFLNGPAGVPPPGEEINFVNPPNLYTVIVVTILVIWPLCSIFFFIRFYTKAFILKALKGSDYVMAIAWIISMGYFAPAWKVGVVSQGRDQWNIRLRDFQNILYYHFIGFIIYSFAQLFLKLSILLQLLEIFSPPSSTTRLDTSQPFGRTLARIFLNKDPFIYTCHAFIVANVGWYFIGAFLKAFQCKPVSAAWNLLDDTGTCSHDLFAMLVVEGVINVVSDIAILVLPQGRIWGLNMDCATKVRVSAVFSAGFLACVAGVMKMVYAILMFKNPHNKTYYLYLLAFWTLPEISLGIIAGCLPSVPRFRKTTLRTSLFVYLSSSVRKLPGLRMWSARASFDVGPGPNIPRDKIGRAPVRVRVRNYWSVIEDADGGIGTEQWGSELSTINGGAMELVGRRTTVTTVTSGDVDVDVVEDRGEEGRRASPRVRGMI
ncbi:hypothetical protein BJY04DRAFT_213684 [Aspergillus karnatakaensis]|uniref:uncharacterized protein n=1 Tax=Aspergillus karnatakaensis TaxID=1810916 RepID=UPI003CCD2B32